MAIMINMKPYDIAYIYIYHYSCIYHRYIHLENIIEAHAKGLARSRYWPIAPTVVRQDVAT